MHPRNYDGAVFDMLSGTYIYIYIYIYTHTCVYHQQLHYASLVRIVTIIVIAPRAAKSMGRRPRPAKSPGDGHAEEYSIVWLQLWLQLQLQLQYSIVQYSIVARSLLMLTRRAAFGLQSYCKGGYDDYQYYSYIHYYYSQFTIDIVSISSILLFTQKSCAPSYRGFVFQR